MQLEALDVSKTFRSRRTAAPVHAVRNATLTARPGQFVAIVGESGSGKSTLARLLLDLLEPTEGSVRLDGREVGSMDRAGKRAYRRSVQAVLQDPAGSLNPRKRVSRAIGEVIRLQGMARTPAETRRRVSEVLELVGMAPAGDYLDRFPHELSGGQRQRAHIAMVLAQDTDYVLLDEPLNNLDLRHATSIMRLLRRTAAERGKTVVLVIHDINIAAAYSDRIIAMKDGSIVADGTPAQIMRTDVLRLVYDMEMQVAEVAGRYVALYFDGEDEPEGIGAVLSTA